METTVTLLLKVDGTAIGVYASADEAEAQAKKYNDDPYMDGEPDADAPYSTRTWMVR